MTTGMESLAATPRIGVHVLRLANGADLPLPVAHSAAAAGMDLRAAVQEPTVLDPGARVLVPTGFAIALPAGHEGQVRPRSGLATEYGVTVLNAPGTIDADYRGEVKVLLVNLGDRPFTITRGMRIAQLVVAPVAAAESVEVSELTATGRGPNGIGSTGLRD